MADIRIKDLPLATGPTAPASNDTLPIDGATTRRSTLSGIAEAVRPAASQSEAEAGVNSVKTMTPLTTKQSIASEVGDTIQAYSAALTAFTGIIPGAAGLDLIQTNTASDARNYLDILKSFNADGVTDDTANWAALRASYPEHDIDCYGRAYLVSAIPNGPVHNGWWVINNYDGLATVRIPMPKTIRATRQKVTNNKRYSAWPQDKAHTYNGVVYAPYNEGLDHTGTGGDMSVWCTRSYDSGFTYAQYERIATNATEQRYCFSAGVGKGQQLFIFRHGNTATDNRLFGRRLFERVNSVTCNVSYTNGNAAYVFDLPGTGLKAGDVVNITLFGAAIGGQSFSGDYTVTSVSSTGFTLTAAGPASGNGSASKTFRIQYTEGGLSHLTFGGLSIDAAVQAASGGVFTSPLTLFHAMEFDGANNPAMYTCGHGGGSTGVYLIKAANVLLSTRSIAFIRQISTQGVEATVARIPGSNRLVGAIRSQDVDVYPVRLWFSDDELATPAKIIDLPGGEFGEQSPVPCRVIGDYIYWFLSGKRTRDGTAGPVGLYTVRIKAANLSTSTTFADLEIIKLDEAYYSAMNVNAVGVPSFTWLPDALLLQYSTEHPPIVADYDGQPNIWQTRIGLAPNGDFDTYSTDGRDDYPVTFSAPWTDNDDIIGSITAAHGISAGAVLERGSTANGEYIKFKDGTLECWKNDLTITFNTVDTLKVDWTFPVAFSASTYASMTLPNTGASYTGAARTAFGSPYSALGTTSVEVGFNRASGAANFAAGNNVINCRARAIGRWY